MRNTHLVRIAEARIRGSLDRFESVLASPARLRSLVRRTLHWLSLLYGAALIAMLVPRLPETNLAGAAVVGMAALLHRWNRESANPDFTLARTALEICALATTGYVLGGPLPILLLVYARQSFRSMAPALARAFTSLAMYSSVLSVVAIADPGTGSSAIAIQVAGSALAALIAYPLGHALSRLDGSVAREEVLHRAAALAASDAGADGQFTRSIPLALQLFPASSPSGLALFTREGDTLTKVTGAGLLTGGSGSMDLAGAPAALRNATVGDSTPRVLTDPRVLSLVPTPDVRYAFVAGLPGGARGNVLVAVSTEKPPLDTVAALTTFALTLSMALEGTSLSRRLEVQRSERRFRSLIQNSTDVVMVINDDFETQYVSPSIEKVFGNLGSGPGTVENLVHPLDLPTLKRAINEANKRGNSNPIECRFRGRGEWLDVELIATDLRNDPDVHGIVLNARDVGERKKLEARLHHQSFHDPLTGLANRSLFTDRAKHALALSRRRGEAVSILFLDIDDFKKINETKGHSAGDTILTRVAERLVGCVRPSDTVGRMDGDEFALLLEDTDAEGASVVAHRVADALSNPIEVEGGNIIVSACAGIATGVGDEASVEDLLRRADLAMHTAKRQNRGRVEVFEPGAFNQILRRFELEFEIERAIAEGEFYLEYQPIYDIKSDQLWGVEALVRWRHPTQGTIPPEDFITAAESTGAIVALERLIVREACNQGVRWIEAGRAVTVSVNLSPRHLADRGIVPALTNILSSTGMPPSLLMLEITESVMADDSEQTIAKLQDLKKLGVRVALDDFGTGYSSLSVLQNLPIDILKIDKTFVEPLGGSDDRSILTPALLRIARTLGLQPIAEGIETREQLDELRRLGCGLGQGFHLGRPVGPNDVFLLTDRPIGKDGRPASVHLISERRDSA